MRNPVCPVRDTGRATLTRIQPELSLHDVVAVSVVPPMAVSFSWPVIPAVDPGFTQFVTVSVSPTVTLVETVWLTVRPPETARAYLPPLALVFGPSSDAPEALQPEKLPSNDGDISGMPVPAGAAGSAG
jgi:hypothetical protein